MTQKEVRVRFAPSPTGFLHIGGVRAALYNWLYARRLGGKFLLRIEDTDRERSKEIYTQDILDSLSWLGLQWDEDIIYQSKRSELYRSYVDRLLEGGFAYRCYCTPNEIDAMREKARQEGRKPTYDRSCRDRVDHPDGKPFVIRARLPLDGSVSFQDLIRGKIEVSNSELDDFIVVRSDGSPTYHLTVVVDEIDNQISHVIRGDDHINNTPKQIHLYRFFDYQEPFFAHLPMILGPDKKKLSKRHGSVSANVYRTEGYLAEAMLNFLVRLGWSHGDQEEFSVEEMCRLFDFEHVQKSPAVFDVDKLNWLNGVYLSRIETTHLRAVVLRDFGSCFSSDARNRAETDLGVIVLKLLQPKLNNLKDLAEQWAALLAFSEEDIDTSVLKWNKKPEVKALGVEVIQGLISTLDRRVNGKDEESLLEGIQVDAGEVGEIVKEACEKKGLKLGMVMQPMRLALTGKTSGAVGVFDVLSIFPWAWVKRRLGKVFN